MSARVGKIEPTSTAVRSFARGSVPSKRTWKAARVGLPRDRVLERDFVVAGAGGIPFMCGLASTQATSSVMRCWRTERVECESLRGPVERGRRQCRQPMDPTVSRIQDECKRAQSSSVQNRAATRHLTERLSGGARARRARRAAAAASQTAQLSPSRCAWLGSACSTRENDRAAR